MRNGHHFICHNKKCSKIHAGTGDHFGLQYNVGDTIGTFIDVAEQSISKQYSLFVTFLDILCINCTDDLVLIQCLS